MNVGVGVGVLARCRSRAMGVVVRLSLIYMLVPRYGLHARSGPSCVEAGRTKPGGGQSIDKT